MRIERVKLTPPPDVESQLGYWVASMDDIRENLKREVKGSTEDELCWQPFPEGDTMGNILLHIAHSESYWIEKMIARKEPSFEIKKELLINEFGPNQTGISTPRQPYQWYFEKLDKTRTRARKTLLKLKDLNLDDIRYQEEGFERIEFSVRWILYHLVEQEAYFRGQIVMIRSFYKTRTAS